jgi:murein DD-endopeptidase MepM/ murein hydrolase activator NlpD
LNIRSRAKTSRLFSNAHRDLLLMLALTVFTFAFLWMVRDAKADGSAANGAQQQMMLVWTGADIDADGLADFANPTGHQMRVHDAFGDGAFGASRDGGVRLHAGVDYEASAGQEVTAPISGFVTRVGLAYGDAELKYVEISNPAMHYTARVFYVEPQVQVGTRVEIGEDIGRAVSLQGRYPGIIDHVHLEILRTGAGGGHIDANRVILARMEPVQTPPF